MSGPLAHRAETQRLARVLGVDPDELEFLQAAPVEVLAELRNDVLDRLLEHSREQFERAVALGDKIPRSLAATLAEHAMGPVLGGRAAALLQADMAVELVKRLPPAFLADVATHVDLRHVGPLVGGIPTDKMEAVGRVLREREEWIVLSAFVGHVPLEKLEQLLAVFDSEALLRGGFVLEDVSRLDTVVALLPEARIAELVDAAHDMALWPEAFALTSHLGPEQAERVLAAIERLPREQIDTLLDAAHREGLWPAVLTFAAKAAPDGGGIVGALDRVPDAWLDELFAAARAHGMWPEAIRLGSHAGPTGADAILAAVERLDPDALAELAAILRADKELLARAQPLIAHAPERLRALLDSE
jgi:hypothetical protein